MLNLFCCVLPCNLVSLIGWCTPLITYETSERQIEYQAVYLLNFFEEWCVRSSINNVGLRGGLFVGGASMVNCDNTCDKVRFVVKIEGITSVLMCDLTLKKGICWC